MAKSLFQYICSESDSSTEVRIILRLLTKKCNTKCYSKYKREAHCYKALLQQRYKYFYFILLLHCFYGKYFWFSHQKFVYLVLRLFKMDKHRLFSLNIVLDVTFQNSSSFSYCSFKGIVSRFFRASVQYLKGFLGSTQIFDIGHQLFQLQ